jgi:uroporphyrinogen-III synthase
MDEADGIGAGRAARMSSSGDKGHRMRIFVFRPPAEAARTATTLRDRGHEPVLAPLFAVARTADPAPEGPFDALVLTSGNAVPALAELPAALRDVPVFSVGARTAAKVREAGHADSRSADGNRDDLIRLIGDTLPATSRLLLIVGRDRHDDVGDRLEQAGFTVAIWTAYAAEAVDAFPEQAREALRQGAVDGGLHYSARGVRTCLDLARTAGVLEPLLDLTHVALSADVAAPLIAAGASTILVAEHPEEAALLAALDQVSARNRDGGGATQEPVAPSGVETDKDEMNDSDRQAASATDAPKSDEKPGQAGRARGKGATRSGRTPPTIEATATEVTPPEPAPEVSPATTEAPATETATSTGQEPTPEAVLPTEALPREFPEPNAALPSRDEPAAADAPLSPPPIAAPAPARSSLPAMALAGLVGGVVGAGIVFFALNRQTPAITPEQVAQLQGRLDRLQTATTELDRKAASAADAAAKAGAAAQSATARVNEVAGAAAPDAAAISELNAKAQRAEATATAVGQQLERNTARIGSVEALAKSAAGPSPQGLAAARIVLAERVQAALASGQPFAADVTALAKGGGSPEQLAALNAVAAAGAPTKDALLAQLRPHRAMFVRELTPASANWQDRLLGLASRVISIRPVGDTGASDPATLPMRLEAAIVRGDNVAAAAAWEQLPEPARRESAAFGEALRKRAAADAAIAKIAQDAVAALGAAG